MHGLVFSWQLKISSTKVFLGRTRQNCTRANVRRCSSTFTRTTSVPALVFTLRRREQTKNPRPIFYVTTTGSTLPIVGPLILTGSQSSREFASPGNYSSLIAPVIYVRRLNRFQSGEGRNYVNTNERVKTSRLDSHTGTPARKRTWCRRFRP